MTAAIVVTFLAVLVIALLLALRWPNPIAAMLIIAVLGGAAMAIYQPGYQVFFVVGAISAAVLFAYLIVRRSIRLKGGSELWSRWLRLKIRPAFTAKGRQAKQKMLEQLARDGEKKERQRDRANDRKRQQSIEREARGVVLVTDDLAQRMEPIPFVMRRRTLDGVYFSIQDELPYPHEDTLALYAKMESGRHGSKPIYCVRKGQVLDDKQVFQAYAPAAEFDSLKKAARVLAKQLDAMVVAIEAREHSETKK